MEELRLYLNSLSLEEQREFATKCGTSIGYLRKALSRNHELGAALCVLIEKFSNGEVTRKDLHPVDWESIWPELMAAKVINALTHHRPEKGHYQKQISMVLRFFAKPTLSNH